MGENEDAPEEEDLAEERKPLGWRDLPTVVNIRDFAQMVGGEAHQIGDSLRLSLESMGRLPFGPIFGFFGLFILSIRSCLLVMVIFIFGTGILLITLMRALGLITRRRSADD